MKASSSSLARATAESGFFSESPGDLPRRGEAPAKVAGEPATNASRGAREARSRDKSERLGARTPTNDPFGPDVILPEQFYDRQNGMEQISGEKALMLAVLEDGIRCFQEHLKNPRVRPRLLARQAEKWIRSADWDWPFSFNNVCDSLALNPDCLRTRLLAPRESGEPAPKPRPSSHRVYRLTPRVKPPRRR
jgi:hypothetical protein